MKIECNLVRRI